MQLRQAKPICRMAILLSAAVLAFPAGVPAEPLVFEEISERAGITFRSTIGDDEMSSLVESTGLGCGFLDYDSDGWLDLYLVNGAHLSELSDPNVPNAEQLAVASDRLYRNRGDATFEDVTERAGILPGGYGLGVLVGDYDNDGDSDIYVTQFGPNRLYRNRGDGTFEEVAAEAGVADEAFSVGATFLDYDRDGDLDLFVGNYVEFDAVYNARHGKADNFAGPLSFKAQPDQLYRNEGNGKFTNVTRQAGLTGPPGRAMGVGSFDYDEDGWQDVFVSNDAMANHLYRNRGDGTFTETAEMAGVALGASGDATGAMAVEFGDVTGDGHVDLYVPDFTMSCLYVNLGGGFFDDQAISSGIARACRKHIKWGSTLADFDCDTDLDLYVVTGDANGLIAYEDHVLTNDGRGRFTDVSASAGPWFKAKRVGRGVARGDIDNDGDVDLLVAALNDAPALLLNTTPRTGKHWLAIDFVGTKSNRDGVGTRVVCTLDDKRSIVRERYSGGSYICSHDRRVHLGLGEVEVVPRLTITWPDGKVQQLENVKAERVMTVHEPD